MPNKKQETPKPDIEYPKTVFIIPMDYESYRDGDDEPDYLNVYASPETADDCSEQGDGEAWIAVYELKEVVRIKKTATIVERVPVKK